MSPARPSPAAYEDYREYLKALTGFLRQTTRSFSYRSFAKRAGFRSPNFLKLVIDGKRNLSADSVTKFAHALGLDADEARAFADLVAYNQAESALERKLVLRKLSELRAGTATSAPARPAAPDAPIKVLVVDDEQHAVALIQRLLRSHFEVLTCTSSTEAIKILRRNPDLRAIITDQRMPDLSGVELLVASADIVPQAIRIIVSAYTDAQSILDAINLARVDRFLTKPIEPSQFVKSIREAIEVVDLRAAAEPGDGVAQ